MANSFVEISHRGVHVPVLLTWNIVQLDDALHFTVYVSQSMATPDESVPAVQLAVAFPNVQPTCPSLKVATAERKAKASAIVLGFISFSPISSQTKRRKAPPSWLFCGNLPRFAANLLRDFHALKFSL